MSEKTIGIKQFFKPVKIQPTKINKIRENVIEKTPQNQTREVDSRKSNHPEKDFRFPENMFGNQK